MLQAQTRRKSALCYNCVASQTLGFVRKWWNWQTHHLEGVAPKGVGVQIPPSAPCTYFPWRYRTERPVSRARRITEIMIILLTVIHVIVSFFLIIVVLLQSGKS